jgi:hypothetical protein
VTASNETPIVATVLDVRARSVRVLDENPEKAPGTRASDRHARLVAINLAANTREASVQLVGPAANTPRARRARNVQLALLVESTPRVRRARTGPLAGRAVIGLVDPVGRRVLTAPNRRL